MRVLQLMVVLSALGSQIAGMVSADTADRKAAAVAAHTLWLDTVQVYPGDNVGFNINLTNAGQTEIDYYDGSIAVRQTDAVNAADVNINDFAHETGDYVYFSDYFENPNGYPLNALQPANSDMNMDFIPATISDLVTLINKIMSGANAGRATDGNFEPAATIETRSTPTATAVGDQADFEVGGIFLMLRTSQPVDMQNVENLNPNMDMRLLAKGAETRLVFCSLDGRSMPAGSNGFLDRKLRADSQNDIDEITSRIKRLRRDNNWFSGGH